MRRPAIPVFSLHQVMSGSNHNVPNASSVGKASGCSGILFGIVFAGFSLVFCTVAAFNTWGDYWKTRNWNATPATLLSTEIALRPTDKAGKVEKDDAEWAGGSEFRLNVRYRYEFNGQKFTGAKWRLDAGESDDCESLSLAQEKIESASFLQCLVNPAAPQESILERRNSGLPLVIWGLLFSLVGVGLIIVSAKQLRTGQAWSRNASSAEVGEGFGGFLMAGSFVTLFLLAGLFVLWQGISGILTEIRAKSWVETPCEILRSGWRSKSASVLYRYTFEGTTYLSDRVSAAKGMSSGKQSRSLRQGNAAVCWVNPEHPRIACLQLKARPWMLILFSIPFTTVGVFGWGFILRHKRKRSVAARTPPPDPAGAVVLRSGLRRLGSLGGAVFVSLFWNGIVSVFLVAAAAGEFPGGWSIWVFLTPFVLVGLLFLAMTLYLAMKCLLPPARVMLSPRILRPGGKLELSWEISPHRLFRPEQVKIRLKGSRPSQEDAPRFRRGSEAWAADLVSASIPLGAFAGGTENFTVPDPRSSLSPDALAVLKWSLELSAVVPRWADISDSWPVEFAIAEDDYAAPDDDS
jgi:hypothetical protein